MIEKVTLVTLHATAAAAAQLTGNGNAAAVGNAQDIYVVAEIDKGDAAALTLTPQRNDAAGTGWIAIANNMRIWQAASTAVSDTLVRATDAVAYTSAAADTILRVVLKINPDSLGLHTGAGTNPITQIRVVVAGGHANDRGSVTAYLVPRYKP